MIPKPKRKSIKKLKQKADKAFSDFIRQRDKGVCITVKKTNDRDRFYKGDVCKKCGKKITIKNKSKLCRSCGQIGNKWGLGKTMSAENRKKLSILRMGEGNPNWTGDNVGDKGLHRWVERRLKKPKKCECCKKNKPYDLANKGVYDRNLENWEWLCRKCHMTKDGRLNNLKQYICKNKTKL
jgi:hypothetical protein